MILKLPGGRRCSTWRMHSFRVDSGDISRAESEQEIRTARNDTARRRTHAIDAQIVHLVRKDGLLGLVEIVCDHAGYRVGRHAAEVEARLACWTSAAHASGASSRRTLL